MAGHGGDRTDAHLVGLAADDGKPRNVPRGSRPRFSATVALMSMQAEALRQLAGIAGGDDASGAAHRL
jgi:hypothetical protein